jgi:membrane dipeptidase
LITSRGRIFIATLIVLVALAAAGRAFLPSQVELRYNKVTHRPPYATSSRSQELQKQITIVDLHADSLLWGRDLLQRSSVGHVDIPRLQQANVAIQIFTVFTKVPKRLNIERNDDASDNVTKLAVAQGWPPRTWNSLLQRALYQAHRLQGMTEASGGKFVEIRSVADLDSFLQRRAHDSSITGAILGLEGGQALEGDVANLDKLYAAGYRMAAPTHFFDTDLAGSSAGMRKGGLSAKGHNFVRAMEQHHMIVDLAHASSSTIIDVTSIARQPLIVSHAGVKGTCKNQRNLSDDELRRVAATGGIVGVGYWNTATCGNDAAAIARAIRYATKIIGTEHVALGSDFDGAATMPFDTTGVPLITDELLKQGFSHEDIAAIMGGNALRVFREVLPKQ